MGIVPHSSFLRLACYRSAARLCLKTNIFAGLTIFLSIRLCYIFSVGCWLILFQDFIEKYKICCSKVHMPKSLLSISEWTVWTQAVRLLIAPSPPAPSSVHVNHPLTACRVMIILCSFLSDTEFLRSTLEI